MPVQEITNLKRYLAKWEIEHLRKLIAELSERLGAAEDDARHGWEAAEAWREDTMQLMQEMMEEGHEIGLTKEGRIGVIAPTEEPVDRMPTLIYLTDVQRAGLTAILQEQGRQGGSIIAQVWPDGIRVARITDQEHDRIREVISPGKEHKFFKTAADAHTDYLRNEAKKPEAA